MTNPSLLDRPSLDSPKGPRVASIDGADSLRFRVSEGNHFDCGDSLSAVPLCRVLHLPLLIVVPALRLVHPELLRHRVLHGNAVLSPHLVIRNPAVFRCNFSVACPLGLVLMARCAALSFTPWRHTLQYAGPLVLWSFGLWGSLGLLYFFTG